MILLTQPWFSLKTSKPICDIISLLPSSLRQTANPGLLVSRRQPVALRAVLKRLCLFVWTHAFSPHFTGTPSPTGTLSPQFLAVPARCQASMTTTPRLAYSPTLPGPEPSVASGSQVCLRPLSALLPKVTSLISLLFIKCADVPSLLKSPQIDFRSLLFGVPLFTLQPSQQHLSTSAFLRSHGFASGCVRLA